MIYFIVIMIIISCRDAECPRRLARTRRQGRRAIDLAVSAEMAAKQHRARRLSLATSARAQLAANMAAAVCFAVERPLLVVSVRPDGATTLGPPQHRARRQIGHEAPARVAGRLHLLDLLGRCVEASRCGITMAHSLVGQRQHALRVCVCVWGGVGVRL